MEDEHALLDESISINKDERNSYLAINFILDFDLKICTIDYYF